MISSVDSGYAINRVKNPDFISRKVFNYIQIGESENIGYSSNENQSVPSKHMEIINSICRKGVTVWHNHNSIGDYLSDNGPVT